MHPTTSSHRVATTLTTSAVAVFAALCLAAPAQAESTDDPVVSPADVRVWENENSGTSPRDGSVLPRSPLTVDDNAIEYVQVGLGALGGMALMGAAAAALSANHRRHEAHPA